MSRGRNIANGAERQIVTEDGDTIDVSSRNVTEEEQVSELRLVMHLFNLSYHSKSRKYNLTSDINSTKFIYWFTVIIWLVV